MWSHERENEDERHWGESENDLLKSCVWKMFYFICWFLWNCYANRIHYFGKVPIYLQPTFILPNNHLLPAKPFPDLKPKQYLIALRWRKCKTNRQKNNNYYIMLIRYNCRFMWMWSHFPRIVLSSILKL